eukprot:TRINITY_DN1028_c0_g2_i1.p1 TRINITY_DN1028_c0_g2~~TRINITY_DN1028_c0_g2_i1.p1  ORF type:complete len:504 (-),score=35.32 TRINITY_DN1028_c0_g2_i1:1980-3491(-)
MFRSKSEIMETVQNMTSITSNHIEFLLRYGLLLKFVLQDATSTEHIFRQLVYLTQVNKYYSTARKNFSLFRGDGKVMFLVACIDNAYTGTIAEINTEFENIMGYQRKELVGYSIVNIMPPMIAKRHGEFVQRFFQTMESSTIGTPRFRFVKRKDGLYMPCWTLLKIIPRLTHGLQVAFCMIEDRKISLYSSYKRDITASKIGAIICDDANRIVGITNEAMSTLQISHSSAKELAKNATLHDVFPQLENQDVASEVAEKEGRVIVYIKNNLPFELERGEDLNVEKSKEEFDSNMLLPKFTLVWVRLVTEEYGNGQEKANILLVSEIPQERQSRYTPVPNFEAIYENKIEGETPVVRLQANKAKKKNQVRDEQLPVKSLIHPEFSPAASVASMASADSGTNKSSHSNETFQELANQLRLQEYSTKMPDSIKKLFVGIILILIGIATLICKLQQQSIYSCRNGTDAEGDQKSNRTVRAYQMVSSQIQTQYGPGQHGIDIYTKPQKD